MAPTPRISIIIPAFNAAHDLETALAALAASCPPDCEVIVSDDGSTDDTIGVARRSPLRPLVITGRRGGPSAARNRGIEQASAPILLFVDADVVVHPDTVERVLSAFEDPTLDAIIGSYDDQPHHPQFLSQYRNLMHCYYHQTGNSRASTFWAGCGAIRRSALDAVGGFDEDRRWHYIEDIELGYRLVSAGKRIALDPAIQVKHRKRWTFSGILRTDILHRGIPWTDLILRDKRAPADLNTGATQRISVAATGILGIALPAGVWWVAAAALVAILALNRGIFQFFAGKRGWWFSLRTLPLFVLYLGYSGLSFLLGVARNISMRSPNRPDATQSSG